MRDDASRVVCCQTADDELLQYQPELFDCARCERYQQAALLDEPNRDAWGLYQQMARRFIVDLGIGPEVFRQLTAGRDPEDVVDRVARCAVIYDIFQPPPEIKK
jgi:hypothetical protein